eukprot:897935_1
MTMTLMIEKINMTNHVQCAHQLVHSLKHYKTNSQLFETNAIVCTWNTDLTLLLLNSFNYLRNVYDSDDEFECLHEEIGSCDIATCKMFKRNYRRRNNHINLNELYHTSDYKQIVFMQCLEKIINMYCNYLCESILCFTSIANISIQMAVAAQLLHRL